jgi:hypothetical protein
MYIYIFIHIRCIYKYMYIINHFFSYS